MNLNDDDFTLLGLPQRFALDRGLLDERWRGLQAKVHPDKFSLEGPAAQRVAMQWAVRVNQAHARLKDPLSRAAYLCELRGAAVDAENNTAMPPAFLMQQMSWREQLDEAGDMDAVQHLAAEVAGETRRLLDLIATTLDDQGDAMAAAPWVRALMFVQRFRLDIDRRLDTLDA
jgi:molecular chaperone HscB